MPSVLVIGGANGAGKSTIAPALIATILGQAEFVNADAIARGIAGARYAEVEFEAGRMFLRRLRELASQRKDFAFESTLSSRTFAPFLRELRESGYEIHLAFVWIGSAEASAERVARRTREGGHSVALEVIERRFQRTVRNLVNLYLPVADSWTLYDNRDGMESRVLAHQALAGDPEIRDQVSWIQIMREGRLERSTD
jgi:predicted ABC-type ATPase